MDTPASIMTATRPESVAVPARRVLSLGLVAGYVDAVGFLDLNGIYTAAMTGNTVQLGISFMHRDWTQLALVGETLGAFFCGGLFSSLVRRHLKRPAGQLFLMALLLAAAQAARLLTPHFPTPELALLAISMAMQGETVSRFGGLSIQTIVVTNNLLKFADAIVGRYVSWRPDDPNTGAKSTRAGLAEVVVPGCAWLGYTIGAGSGAMAVGTLPAPFLVPIMLLVLTACDLLFARARQER